MLKRLHPQLIGCQRLKELEVGTWPNSFVFHIKKNPKPQKPRLWNGHVLFASPVEVSPNPRLSQRIPLQSRKRRSHQPVVLLGTWKASGSSLTHLKFWPFLLNTRALRLCGSDNNPLRPRSLSRFWIPLPRTWKAPYIFENWRNWGNLEILPISHPNIRWLSTLALIARSLLSESVCCGWRWCCHFCRLPWGPRSCAVLWLWSWSRWSVPFKEGRNGKAWQTGKFVERPGVLTCTMRRPAAWDAWGWGRWYPAGLDGTEEGCGMLRAEWAVGRKE